MFVFSLSFETSNQPQIFYASSDDQEHPREDKECIEVNLTIAFLAIDKGISSE